MTRTLGTVSCTVFLLAALAAETAVAQQIELPGPEAGPAGETVRSRPRPEVEPLGVRAGSFLIYPQVGAHATYDDNIFASNDDTQDDFIINITPEVLVASNFNNHAVNFRVGGDFGRYADVTRLNYTDWFVGTDGRLDIQRNAALFAGIEHREDHEDPGDPDADPGSEINIRRPSEYGLTEGFLRYRQTVGRTTGAVDASVARLNFEPADTESGVDDSNADRDRTIYTGTGRFGYELVPAYEAFVSLEGNSRVYDGDSGTAGSRFSRDSEGVTANVGVDLDLGGVLAGEVYIGYLGQYYDDAEFDDINTFNAGGGLTWNVTTLTTLNARVARIVQETTTAGASAALRTTGSLAVDHELLRTLILSGVFTVTNDDFEGADREDYYYIGEIGARYLINRYVYADLSYRYAHRDSSGSVDVKDNNYEQNLVRFGFTGQL